MEFCILSILRCNFRLQFGDSDLIRIQVVSRGEVLLNKVLKGHAPKRLDGNELARALNAVSLYTRYKELASMYFGNRSGLSLPYVCLPIQSKFQPYRYTELS